MHAFSDKNIITPVTHNTCMARNWVNLQGLTHKRGEYNLAVMDTTTGGVDMFTGTSGPKGWRSAAGISLPVVTTDYSIAKAETIVSAKKTRVLHVEEKQLSSANVERDSVRTTSPRKNAVSGEDVSYVSALPGCSRSDPIWCGHTPSPSLHQPPGEGEVVDLTTNRPMEVAKTSKEEGEAKGGTGMEDWEFEDQFDELLDELGSSEKFYSQVDSASMDGSGSQLQVSRVTILPQVSAHLCVSTHPATFDDCIV